MIFDCFKAKWNCLKMCGCFYTQCLPVCTAWLFAYTKDIFSTPWSKILGITRFAELEVLVLASNKTDQSVSIGHCSQPAVSVATEVALPMQLKARAGLMDCTMAHHSDPQLSPATPTPPSVLLLFGHLWCPKTSWLCRELPCATPGKSGAYLHSQTESCALGVIFTVRDQHIFQLHQGSLHKQKNVTSQALFR